MINGMIQTVKSRAPHAQRRPLSPSKSQKHSSQANEGSDTVGKTATAKARLMLQLKNLLYELKAILGWQERVDQHHGGKPWRRHCISHILSDHFAVLMEAFVTAGRILFTEWHNNTTREALKDQEKPQRTC